MLLLSKKTENEINVVLLLGLERQRRERERKMREKISGWEEWQVHRLYNMVKVRDYNKNLNFLNLIDPIIDFSFLSFVVVVENFGLQSIVVVLFYFISFDSDYCDFIVCSLV